MSRTNLYEQYIQLILSFRGSVTCEIKGLWQSHRLVKNVKYYIQFHSHFNYIFGIHGIFVRLHYLGRWILNRRTLTCNPSHRKWCGPVHSYGQTTNPTKINSPQWYHYFDYWLSRGFRRLKLIMAYLFNKNIYIQRILMFFVVKSVTSLITCWPDGRLKWCLKKNHL